MKMIPRCSSFLKVVFILLAAFISGESSLAQNAISNSLLRQYNKFEAIPIRVENGGAAEVCYIANQLEFDNIQTKIQGMLQMGVKNLEVRILPGVYLYTENHLSFCDYNAPDISISIYGNDVSLIAGGDDYWMQKSLFSRIRKAPYEQSFPYGSVLLTDDLSEVSFGLDVQKTDRLLEVINQDAKICRIHTADPQRFKIGKYIIVTTWYTSVSGPIIKIEDDWIYFKSSSLFYAKSYKDFNINYEYAYSKQYPRYVVLNDPKCADVYIDKGLLYSSLSNKSLHQCNNSTFLLIKNARFKKLSIEGLSFIGSAEGKPLLSFISAKCQGIVINNCVFRSLKNFAIGVDQTDNVLVSHCTFRDCYKSCVRSYVGSKHTQITECLFTDNGRDFSQYNCVWCQGEDYYISRNRFRNFSYAAIRTGLLPDEKKKGTVSGIIEYNEIYYDKDFFNSYSNHTLMDSGAIYVSTQNDNTIIRYNYIHDYIGLKDNRGVFCDTGTQNTHIYGNVILNVPNSYSIDIWRVKTFDNIIPDANEGNAVFLNIVNGKYRFEGKGNTNNNIQGSNFIFYQGAKPKNVNRELKPVESDYYIESLQSVDLKRVLDCEIIAKSPIWQNLQYFYPHN